MTPETITDQECERCGEIPAFCPYADYEEHLRPPKCANYDPPPED